MELMYRSATYLPEDGGRTLGTPWGLVTYKISARQTGGAYSLFEWKVRPQGRFPPHRAPQGRVLLCPGERVRVPER